MRKLALVFVLLAAVFGFWWFGLRQPDAKVVIANQAVNVELATTPEAKAKGLSGRSSLPPGQGMLFVYDAEEYPGIWMKEMQFSIDIIWLSSSATVVHTASDVAPSTYPQVFYPSQPAQYVLEVPAGFVLANNINVGQAAELPKL